MYSLDYDMVVQVLQRFNYSGEAHANIPIQRAGKGDERVILHVQNGAVISCIILDTYGQKRYRNTDAQRHHYNDPFIFSVMEYSCAQKNKEGLRR